MFTKLGIFILLSYCMEESIHHIFPKDERDIYNVHIKENKLPIDRKEHDALHVFFGNSHPKEQLYKLLQLHTSIIAPDIVEVLKEILELSEEEFYIQDIFNRKQH